MENGIILNAQLKPEKAEVWKAKTKQNKKTTPKNRTKAMNRKQLQMWYLLIQLYQ